MHIFGLKFEGQIIWQRHQILWRKNEIFFEQSFGNMFFFNQSWIHSSLYLQGNRNNKLQFSKIQWHSFQKDVHIVRLSWTRNNFLDDLLLDLLGVCHNVER